MLLLLFFVAAALVVACRCCSFRGGLVSRRLPVVVVHYYRRYRPADKPCRECLRTSRRRRRYCIHRRCRRSLSEKGEARPEADCFVFVFVSFLPQTKRMTKTTTTMMIRTATRTTSRYTYISTTTWAAATRASSLATANHRYRCGPCRFQPLQQEQQHPYY